MPEPAKLVQKSQVEVTPKDQRQIDQKSQLERSWHKNTPRYQTRQDVITAFQNKELVRIGLTKNYRPITRLLNPDTDLQYPPFLKKNAQKVLNKLTKRWRKQLTKEFGQRYKNVLLALTFLVSSEEYKKELLNTPGKILNAEGTHATGYTFDIDASSYYIQDGGNFYSVTDPRRNPSIVKKSTSNLIKIGGPKMHTLTSKEEYSSRITEILTEEAQKLFKEGLINLIIEYPGTQNCCLHICTKP